MRGLEVMISELSQMIAHTAGLCDFSGSCVDCGTGCRIHTIVQFYAKVQYYLRRGGKMPTINQCEFCKRLSYCEGQKFKYNKLFETCENFILYEPVRYFYETLREYIIPGNGKF